MGKIVFLLLISILLVCPAALAEESYKEKQIKKLGGKVTETTNDKGETIRHIEFSSGVTIEESPSGGLGIDSSGHGAVLCSREIFIAMRDRMEICSEGENVYVKERLDKAIDRINDFIVENNLQPITKEALQDQEKRKLEKSKKQKDQEDICSSEELQKFVDYMEQNIEKFEKGVEDSLSVPRPPVLNPCL